ncbi:MAG: NAD(P)H-dependent oxidoreductase subunit E [Nitrospirae bacterium]|nr:NAD(P)H-dependent oxidoreductase subunit E [Nitrospirota bacterium]MBF0536359.1 NAD(P)H-dependent oxidoreductase subunit E [Nitrospirota bacterium]MBF0616590.1 NAD(P)H-dependent oxidoreductase subunit E [Nitrospirota bacterium]
MKGKILVVDDDNIIIRSCKGVLEPMGYDVSGTINPREALDLIRDNNYDLLITDMIMPGIDGFELIKRTKELKPDTTVIAMTGYSIKETIKDTLEYGIMDYLQKPFSPNILADTVDRVTNLARKLKSQLAITEEDDADGTHKIEAVNALIKQYKTVPGSLITVLSKTQEIIGYLPPAIQRLIAKGLRIPVSEVHSVVSFYPCYTMKVRGRHNIRVCIGAACYAKKADSIVQKLCNQLHFDEDNVTDDKKFSYELVRCLGACASAPVIEVDHDTHGTVDPDKITDILKDYN